MCVPAVVAILPASILVTMPPRAEAEPETPAIASISGVMRVGQQHEKIGAHHRGDARGQAIIVAVTNLAGRHRIVLVDHRHAAPLQQLGDGRARVEIAAALFGVAQCDQHLAGSEFVRA